MEYSKPAISIEEQIEKLKSRGLHMHIPVILTHQSGDIDPPLEFLDFGWRLY
jgi:hypothetical protein